MFIWTLAAFSATCARPMAAATPAQAAPAAATVLHRYVLLGRAPRHLRYRNGTVLLELVRDCSADLPTWVFRARRVAPRGGSAPRHTGPAGMRLPSLATTVARPATSGTTARPLPTVSPIALAAAAQHHAGRSGTVVIASSLYGRLHLEQMLRVGVLLESDSPAARVMDALVTLSYATCRPTNATHPAARAH